jgi:alkylhydroperoxidase family enzyme
LFSPEEQAVLRFTDLLTSYPGNIDSVDVEQLQARFSEAQIVELVVTIATTNWTNRINDGLQTPLG